MALSCVPNPLRFEELRGVKGHYYIVCGLTRNVRTAPAFPSKAMKAPTLEPTESMREELRELERGIDLKRDHSDDSELEDPEG